MTQKMKMSASTRDTSREVYYKEKYEIYLHAFFVRATSEFFLSMVYSIFTLVIFTLFYFTLLNLL